MGCFLESDKCISCTVHNSNCIIFFFLSLKTYLHMFPSFMQTVDVLRHQWAYSCDKAKKELDYNPRSLEQGLIEVPSWLKSLGLIKY